MMKLLMNRPMLTGILGIANVALSFNLYAAHLNHKNARATLKRVDTFAEQCGRFDTVKIKGQYLANSKSALELAKIIRSNLQDKIGMKNAAAANLVAMDQAIPESTFSGKFNLDPSCTSMANKLEKLEEVAALEFKLGNTRYTEVGFLKRYDNKPYLFTISGQYKITPKSKFNWDTSYFDFEIKSEDRSFTDSELVSLLSSKERNRVVKSIDQARLYQARKAIIDMDSTAYGSAIYEGRYLNPHTETQWRLSTVVDGSGKEYRVVYFDEYDDGSYSVFFSPDSAVVQFVVYEN